MKCALDTNILVRICDRRDSKGNAALREVSERESSGQRIVLLPQTLIEFWAVATRPRESNGLGLSPNQANRFLAWFLRLFPLEVEHRSIVLEWRRLVAAYGVSGRAAHDARLVAAMILADVPVLMTFDVGHFRRYAEIEVIEPAADE